MKHLDRVSILAILIITFITLTGADCFKKSVDSIDSKDGCGDKTQWARSYNWDEFTNTDLRDTVRTFYYIPSATPTDICVNKHTTLKYSAFPGKGSPFSFSSSSKFNIYGFAQWGLFERESWLTYSSVNGLTYYNDQEDIGLGQITSPAEIGFVVQLTFRTRGTLQEDLRFLDSCISTVGINYEYYKVE